MAKININNFYEAGIQDWQDYFDEIFCDRNSKLEPRLIWFKVIEHSTKIAEGIRKREFFEAISSVSRIFCWMCSFISSNQDLIGGWSLDDIIWHKYPRTCSYCVPPFSNEIKKEIDKNGGLSCRCGPDIEQISQKTVNREYLEDYREKFQKPRSLDDWGKMFNAIYSHNHYLMSLDSICFHLLEEVGEVLTAMRTNADFIFNIPKNEYSFKKAMEYFGKEKIFREIFKKEHAEYEDFIEATKRALREEIADVISWLFSLTTKLLSLRISFSNYGKDAYELIKEIPEGEAFSKLTGYDILRPPLEEDRLLNLSSILFIWYRNGCTLCKSLRYSSTIKCQCQTYLSPLFIMLPKDNVKPE